MSSAPLCKRILIFGATGLVGSRISREFVRNRSHFDRVAIFTSPATLAAKSEQIRELKNGGAEIIVGDLTSVEDVTQAYQGIDTVISCVGRAVIDHQMQLIRLANDSPSVHRFLPSEYGTDIEYGPSSATEIPHQKKLKVRAAIRACDRLDHTFLVTGPYADADPGLYFSANSAAKHTGSFDVEEKTAVLLGDGARPISFTTMNDVGKLVVLATQHPAASRNRALKVRSFTATDAEILQEFERQTGAQPWQVSHTSLDDLRKGEQDAVDAQNPLATIFTLRRIWAEGGTLYDQYDNALIGAENVTEALADAVTEAIHVQQHV